MGIPNATAKAFAVPLGIIPNGILVLITALATAETVPSPPDAINKSTSCSTASRANSVGSVSGVVK